MKTNALLFASTSLLICLASSPGKAANTGFFGLSIGYYNVLDNNDHATDFRLEYRPATSLVFKNLRPWTGLEITTHGSLWAGGGLLYDINLGKNLYLTPSFGAGYYAHGKGDKNLSHPVQFRSQIELAYALKNESRISLAFSHLSNAHLGKHNPGTEVLSLYYHYPI